MHHQRASIPVLDGLRGLAALIVMVSHGANAWAGGALLGQGAGQLGVMLFFVLSGFLMGYLYLRRPWAVETALQFAMNRIGRVVPLFFVVVIGSYLAQRWQADFWAYPIATMPSLFEHLMFVRGVDVLWSVGPEIIFYGLFAGLWFLSARSRSAAVALAGLALALSVVPFEVTGNNSLTQLHFKLPYFLVGTGLGAVWRPGVWPLPSPWLRRLLIAAGALLLLASFPQILLWLEPLAAIAMVQITPPWSKLWASPYYFVLIVMFFVSALWLGPGWLDNRVLRKLGALSYAVYLTHMLVLKNAPTPAEAGWLTAIAIYAGATLAVAWILHWLVELPARGWFRGRASRQIRWMQERLGVLDGSHDRQL